MTMEVSFKEAAKVAVCSIFVGVTAPASIPTALAAIAVGALTGHYSVEFIDQIKAGYLQGRKIRRIEDEINRLKQEEQLLLVKMEKSKLYQLAPRRYFDPVTEVESLQRSLARMKIQHPEAMQYYLKIENCNTEEETIRHFQERLAGQCNGQTRCMLEMAKKEKQFFSPELILKMAAEDVFYRQIQEFVHSMLNVFKQDQAFDVIDKKLMSPEEYSQITFYETHGFGELASLMRAPKKIEFDQSVSRLCRDHLSRFSLSEEFNATQPALVYKNIFTKVTGSSKDHVLGYLSLPRHVFAFQCTPEAYFIYDVYSEVTGGLHKYPTQELFFENLRNLAIEDIKSQGKDAETTPVKLAIDASTLIL